METTCVNIAEYFIAKSPSIIETRSLGSCVGIVLYDITSKIGGLAHVMLPDSKKVSFGGKPGKYADIAIDTMLKKMIEIGANKNNIVAKIAGGACMFTGPSVSDFMNIGLRNVTAIKSILKELKIPLIAEDTGGTYGRTIEFHMDIGKLIIKSSMAPTKEI
jgi:chemotaxis protein CheD